jgi:hypothetical protein
MESKFVLIQNINIPAGKSVISFNEIDDKNVKINQNGEM